MVILDWEQFLKNIPKSAVLKFSKNSFFHSTLGFIKLESNPIAALIQWKNPLKPSANVENALNCDCISSSFLNGER